MISKCLQRIGFRFSQDITKMTPAEKINYLNRLEENAYVEYKRYPFLPHQDPSSQEYIHSQLDQYHEKTQTQAYNAVIDNFKNDLAMQRKVWDAISNLDRPYKRGIPGIDTNIDPNGVYKHKFQDIGFKRRQDPMVTIHETFKNEDRWIANTPFHHKHNFKHYLDWEIERANRPVTKNYSHQKGYKYDVPVSESQKYDFVADRLGHPEYLGTPIERLFKLENDIYHPTYLDQPFVKMPSAKPDQSLNFEQGQVLYENTRISQWLKFWQWLGVAGGGFLGLFVPYNMAFKTNLVTDAADQLLFTPLHLVSPHVFDIMRLSIPITAGAVFYTVYLLMNYANQLTRQYAIKVNYSKDKELLFVKRLDIHGVMEEEVYEAAHLQILPPTNKSALSGLSSQDEDGIWKVTCLNTQRTFLLYNDPRHWNIDLRKGFFKQTLGLWDKSYYGYNRPEAQQNQYRQRADLTDSLDRQTLPK